MYGLLSLQILCRSDGLGYGNNGRAALITRGLAEISRIALKLGANPLTLAGLAGMGDLVLTCTGAVSTRNRILSSSVEERRESKACFYSSPQVSTQTPCSAMVTFFTLQGCS